MVYDKRDRLVLIQDGVQRAKTTKEWFFTKYDILNRPIISGIFTSSKSRSGLQTDVNNHATLFETFNTGGTHGYTNVSFPTTSISQYLTITYYDNYDFLALTEFDSNYDFGSANGMYTETQNPYVSGLMTGGKVLSLEDGNWLINSLFYDKDYRVIRGKSKHQKGINKVYVKYDFLGNATNTQLVHTYSGEPTITINESFAYDHVNRLLSATHQINNGDVITLFKNEYNELGQLVDKKLHSDNGSTFQQSVDYRFNIRGWLTSINNAALTTGSNNDDTNDYFGMELGYNNTLGFGSKKTYNGSISQTKWSTFSNAGGSTQYGNEYDYDNMKRLVKADFHNYSTAWADNAGLEVDVDYDINGNITALSRKGRDATTIDNLTYDYGADGSAGNQLLKVDDGGTSKGFVDGTNTGNDYSYDENGNLKVDNNKGITDIQYNLLNLPRYLRKDVSNNITFKYAANGVKLTKESIVAGAVTTTNYIGNFIYVNNKLQYIMHPEGRVVVRRDGSNNISGYEYQYHLKDHQGNTRVTFSSDPEPANFMATMEPANEGYESQYFGSIDGLPATGKNKTPGGDEVLVLGAKQVGGVFIREVMPGDEVDISVWGAYQSGSSSSATAEQMATAVALSFGEFVSGSGEAAHVMNSVQTGVVSLASASNKSTSNPGAYLNYIVFNRDLVYVNGGIADISDNTSGNMQQYAINNISITQRGYLYIFLTNETTGSENAFYDDLDIEIISPVVQADDYYPFGMSIAESEYRHDYSSVNKHLYNGKELQTELALNWNDYGFRMYDPAIGRWHVKEPLADQMPGISTYAYAYNNPVNFVDHLGLAAGPPNWMRPVHNKAADADGDGFVTPSEKWNYDNNDFSGAHDWSVLQHEQQTFHEQMEEAARIGDLQHFEISKFNYSIYGYYLEYVVSGQYRAASYYDFSGLASGSAQTSGGGSSLGSDFVDGFLNGPVSNPISAGSIVGGQGLILEGTNLAVRADARYTPKYTNRITHLRNVAQASKYVRVAGSSLGVVGGLVTGVEALWDGELSYGDAFKLINAGASILLPGYGLVYGGVDIVTQIWTGTSLTDRIANGIDQAAGSSSTIYKFD
jgi:RHS repeat-associated protein